MDRGNAAAYTKPAKISKERNGGGGDMERQTEMEVSSNSSWCLMYHLGTKRIKVWLSGTDSSTGSKDECRARRCVDINRWLHHLHVWCTCVNCDFLTCRSRSGICSLPRSRVQPATCHPVGHSLLHYASHFRPWQSGKTSLTLSILCEFCYSGNQWWENTIIFTKSLLNTY